MPDPTEPQSSAAVEDDALPVVLPARPLPARAQLEPRALALAAAGGFVAGAATLVVARAASSRRRTRRGLRRRREQLPEVVLSRSFLINVHLLDR